MCLNYDKDMISKNDQTFLCMYYDNDFKVFRSSYFDTIIVKCVYETGEGWRGVTIKCSLEFTHV